MLIVRLIIQFTNTSIINRVRISTTIKLIIITTSAIATTTNLIIILITKFLKKL